MILERIFHQNLNTSLDFDEKIDPEFDGNEVNKEENHEIEENVLPVGEKYEENFMRQVENW